jgi:hypothetical protein
LPLHLRVDHRVEAVPPGPPLYRRDALTGRKAAQKIQLQRLLPQLPLKLGDPPRRPLRVMSHVS